MNPSEFQNLEPQATEPQSPLDPFRNMRSSVAPILLALGLGGSITGCKSPNPAPGIESKVPGEYGSVEYLANNAKHKLTQALAPEETPKGGPLIIPEESIQRIKQKYGEEAYNGALQLILNGYRIHISPTKSQNINGTIKDQLVQKYSGRIKLAKFFGFLDEPKELEQMAAILHYHQKVMKRGSKIGVELSPAFVIAAMSNEGHLLDINQGQSMDQPVNGFYELGLDWFGDEVDSIKEMGLLPKDFACQITLGTNEKGHTHKTARFSSKNDAFHAFIATLAYRQKLMLNNLKTNGVTLESLSTADRHDVVSFLTYAYFNGGSGVGRSMIKSLKTDADVLAYFKTTQTNPALIKQKSVPANAYVVMAGMEWMERAGATDTNPQGKGYWWLQDKEPGVNIASK